MKNLVTALSFICLVSLGYGQQEEKLTCHRLHNAVKPAPLTDYQKTLLNESNQRSDTFDIQNYNINIDITDYSGQYIEANTIIDVRALMDGVETIGLDLYQLTVDSVKVGSETTTYTYDGAMLRIDLLSPSVVNEDFQVSVWYRGNPHHDPQWGGFYFENNYIYNLGIGLSTIPPNFGKVWYPCFDTFVERATYDFHVLSDDGFIPRCQGLLISEEELEGDTILSYYRMPIPIPTYLSAIAASAYETVAYVHEGAYGPIPVELQAKSNHVNALNTRFANLGQVIDAQEYWFGPYIWNKVGYAMTVVGAMEHPTNIAYQQSMMSAGVVSNEQLYSHELGHLWFGDIVSPEIHNHMWLKEGHAEYSSHLAREWISGHDAFLGEVKDNQLVVLETAHADDEGFFPLSPIPDEVIYGRHSYYKGAAAVHSLRGYVGDSLFRVGLQGVLDTFYLGHMNPEQYQSAFENSTGYDLSDFMEDQIYAPGFSTFTIDSAITMPSGGQYLTTFYLQQGLREAPHYHNNVPLDFTLLDENWETHSFNEVVSGQYAVVDIYSDFEPLEVSLNGDHRINQATMGYTEVLRETTNTLTLPWVDMKLKVEEIADTAYFQAHHHWVAPDASSVSDDIIALSSSHYWTVGGVWSDSLFLKGRYNYAGAVSTMLDFDLVGETEAAIGLAYRADASESWDIFPYYTLVAGGDNGSGYIKVDSLLAGEYAFANVELSVGLSESEIVEESWFELYPNPSADKAYLLTVQPGKYQVKLIDAKGSVVMEDLTMLDRQSPYLMELLEYPAGIYTLTINSPEGRLIEQLKLIRN